MLKIIIKVKDKIILYYIIYTYYIKDISFNFFMSSLNYRILLLLNKNNLFL